MPSGCHVQATVGTVFLKILCISIGTEFTLLTGKLTLKKKR